MNPVIENIIVDMDALLSISHSCEPLRCSASMSCCSYFHVCVNENELQRLIGFMPDASVYSERLKSGPSLSNVFSEIESELFAIDTDDKGLCVFAYYGREKETLCSLHSAALDAGYPPEKVKPNDCMLWPLALTEEEPWYLTIDNDAFAFSCNKQRKCGMSTLDPGVADIIKRIFGEGFLRKLEDYIKEQTQVIAD